METGHCDTLKTSAGERGHNRARCMLPSPVAHLLQRVVPRLELILDVSVRYHVGRVLDDCRAQRHQLRAQGLGCRGEKGKGNSGQVGQRMRTKCYRASVCAQASTKCPARPLLPLPSHAAMGPHPGHTFPRPLSPSSQGTHILDQSNQSHTDPHCPALLDSVGSSSSFMMRSMRPPPASTSRWPRSSASTSMGVMRTCKNMENS